jgi:acyl-CoA synthetase (AMP-forming)/AMP-acid ligase II
MTTVLEINTQRGGPYSAGLGKTEANYASLSPLSFLPKAAETYPNRIAVIHGEQRRTWAETYARCRRLASALHKRGIGSDDISSIEVEDVLHRHPAVDSAAVVAKPDPKWGEVPCAFIELRPNTTATEVEIRQFCREQMAGYKVPKRVVFGPIPKNATGKIQKLMLREVAKGLGS